MSEGITLTFLALALIVAFVIIAWAALTFGRVDRSGQDKRIHLFFSGTLPAGLLIIYLIRRYLDPGYGTAALVVLLLLAIWLGSLVLFLSGIRLAISARSHREPYANLLVAAFLSGSIFLVGCILMYR